MSETKLRFYDVGEAAKLLHYARATVRAKCAQGKLPCKRVGLKYLVVADALDALLATQARPAKRSETQRKPAVITATPAAPSRAPEAVASPTAKPQAQPTTLFDMFA